MRGKYNPNHEKHSSPQVMLMIRDEGLAEETRGELKSVDAHQVGDQSEVERFFGTAEAYGSPGVEIQRIDTHAAMVFLAGDRAYKIKRAVKYPYLDFSTLAQREAACRHEVEVNRRTAPDIYLGVCAVRRDAEGGLYLECGKSSDSLDPVVEWAVQMRRFDREDMLDRLAERQALNDDLLEDLAQAIAGFHASAEPCPPGFAAAESFIDILRGNDLAFEEYQRLFPRRLSSELTRHSLDLVDGYRDLFAKRVAERRIRHCHGDLHLANIVMQKGRPVLFDAIEFDDEIATIDVFYDLAFLLMDLWQRGCHREANFVLNRYLMITADYAALALLPLFLATRASIRAKVSAAQGHNEDAQSYFRHAVEFLQSRKPDCFAIGGLSGSGKTSVSRALAPLVGSAPGAVHLRSDVIRKEMFGVPEKEPLPSSCYNRETSAQVYNVLLQRARQVLETGQSVILDAVFAAPEERRAVEEIAASQGQTVRGFWLSAPKSILKDRVSARRNDASDATPDVVEQQTQYDLGQMSWHLVESDAAPGLLADRILGMPSE